MIQTVEMNMTSLLCYIIVVNGYNVNISECVRAHDASDTEQELQRNN